LDAILQGVPNFSAGATVNAGRTEAREKGDHSAILLNKNLAFNLGGQVNHSIWWKNLSPDGGDKPTGETGRRD
jgi:superoxide dismutase